MRCVSILFEVVQQARRLHRRGLRKACRSPSLLEGETGAWCCRRSRAGGCGLDLLQPPLCSATRRAAARTMASWGTWGLSARATRPLAQTTTALPPECLAAPAHVAGGHGAARASLVPVAASAARRHASPESPLGGTPLPGLRNTRRPTVRFAVVGRAVSQVLVSVVSAVAAWMCLTLPCSRHHLHRHLSSVLGNLGRLPYAARVRGARAQVTAP
mmetsp:Transcript_53127/g.123675  ORF Transcript_53127/g.123675 Transcript_53127/m.123675 type:complete len:215 (+) Transcript_53127:107-751(+)